ncbi:MAG: flagellar hook-length control protein FliK, partial [Campylobacterota bacterium]|nr:flagellar hook-length control protein FliK [Campylobacterota bacterium]
VKNKEQLEITPDKKIETNKNTQSIINNNKEDSKTPLIANMFLNSQKKLKETVSMQQVKDAKTNIEEKKSVKSIKESASMLNLNAEETEVKTQNKNESKIVDKLIVKKTIDELNHNTKQDAKKLESVRFLDRIVLNNHINEVKETSKNIEKTAVRIVDEIIADDNSKELEVPLNVPKEVVETIQSKIIGAQQKVGTFMSEVARNMYLNYKAPFTAFRVNLNPANLGSISIVMKANKMDNSVSVSMNMSNNATMETFTENKAALQTALQRQLTETSDVSLSFNMQGDNSNNNFDQQSKSSDDNKQNRDMRTVESTNINKEEQDIEENIEYM